ncbi:MULTISPECIES: hypothetical protein [unclassified Brevundimonas]|uniref:hypothetical protein n=1 Tax=unclassified Brevundimonas TaxID=2622653 RepID=UPI003F9312A8
MSDYSLPPKPPEEDPTERDLSRRSGNPSVSPWLLLMGVVLLGVVVYAASALLPLK